MTDELLSYASVLAESGPSARCIKGVRTVLRATWKEPDAARQVAEALSRSPKEYDALEPYLRCLMESGDENQLRNAFIQLAEVLRQTDRPKEIGRLITDYLAI
ncbi:MAG: hypothetical protein R3E66_21885 [bacterium]